MILHSSGEDYLKAILILQKEKGAVRSVDVSEYMGVSKPSVSHAMKTLILRLRRKKPAVWNTQSAMNRSMS